MIVAMDHGYATWKKYESFLSLHPAVREVIEAVNVGDLEALKDILDRHPAAANPVWTPGYKPEGAWPSFPNDSIPLHCVSEAVYSGSLSNGNEYTITEILIDSGADPDIGGGLPLVSAVGYNAIQVVECLLEKGAAVDGVDGDGVPMAYPMEFGFTEVSELLASRGAKLDLRFAAGLGKLDVVEGYVNPDGTLKPDAGALADVFGYERKQQGEKPIRFERTPETIKEEGFYLACLHHRFEAAEFLLGQGVDINAKSPNATALHRVSQLYHGWTTSTKTEVEARRIPIVEFLLARGAEPSVQDDLHKSTALEWAKHAGFEMISEILHSHINGG